MVTEGVYVTWVRGYAAVTEEMHDGMDSLLVVNVEASGSAYTLHINRVYSSRQ